MWRPNHDTWPVDCKVTKKFETSWRWIGVLAPEGAFCKPCSSMKYSYFLCYPAARWPWVKFGWSGDVCLKICSPSNESIMCWMAVGRCLMPNFHERRNKTSTTLLKWMHSHRELCYNGEENIVRNNSPWWSQKAKLAARKVETNQRNTKRRNSGNRIDKESVILMKGERHQGASKPTSLLLEMDTLLNWRFQTSIRNVLYDKWKRHYGNLEKYTQPDLHENIFVSA